MIEAVVFDLDGVLVDSEHLWDRARRELVAERGGRWRDGATQDMMGMSCEATAILKNGQMKGTIVCAHASVTFTLNKS